MNYYNPRKKIPDDFSKIRNGNFNVAGTGANKDYSKSGDWLPVGTL